MSALDHIRYLSETIGPRGSTREGERRAAQYVARVLQEAGYEPRVEGFRSARSAYHPYLVFCLSILLSEAMFLIAEKSGATAGLILTSAALVSILLELSFRNNPIRWLIPKASSQNVWARVPGGDQVRQKVVLLGHLDSHRTPLFFSSERWLQVFGRLVPAGLGASLVMILLFGIGVISTEAIWRLFSLPLALLYLVLLVLFIQADRTPFSPGANDNASGAGVVLSIAQQLRDDPLVNTEVWTALTGCEEVACYGADAFARAHHGQLAGALWFTVDSVGTQQANPTYTTRETFLRTSQSDPDLVSLAESIAANSLDIGAKPHIFKGAYSEGAIGAKYGFRVLSFGSSRSDGSQPDWHRMTDIFDNVNPEVVQRSERFIWAILHAVDSHLDDELPHRA